MSTAITTVDQMLLKSAKTIQDVLPITMQSERFISVALTTIRKSPKLQQCNPLSVCSAVKQAAQLGLEFSDVLGQAYLVPYGTEATLLIGYRGLIDLARRSGHIKKMEARAVYEGDFFDYELGLESKLVHRPLGKNVKPVHFYAVATLTDGSHQFEVMSKEQIDEHRDKFARKGSDAWGKSYEEMAKKTVVRRLLKLLPLSTDLANALEYEATQHDYHAPEKLERALDAQKSLSTGEEKQAQTRWLAAAEEANRLGIDYSDFPAGDHTPPIVLGYAVELERRVSEWKTSRPESVALS